MLSVEDWAEIRRLYRAEAGGDQGDLAADEACKEHRAVGYRVGTAAAVSAASGGVGGGRVRAGERSP